MSQPKDIDTNLPPKQPPIPDKQQAIALLYEDGVPVSIIAKNLKVTQRWVRKVLQKFRISPLTEPSIVKESIKTIRNHATGQPARKGQDAPKDTVVQRAAEYIHDTTFPQKQVIEHSGSVIVGVVDLGKYRQGVADRGN